LLIKNITPDPETEHVFLRKLKHELILIVTFFFLLFDVLLMLVDKFILSVSNYVLIPEFKPLNVANGY